MPLHASTPRAPLSGESLGMALVVCAMALFSCMDVIAKDMMTRHEPLQVVWARYASQVFWAFLIFAPRLNRLMRTDRLGLQVLRSILLFGATFCGFNAFAVMPLATAVAIFEIAPLLITAIAFFVLKEKVGLRRWAGVAAGFAGALIIIRPGGADFSLAVLWPLAGALSFAGYAITTRIAGGAENPWTSFLYSAVFGALVASVLVPFHWTTPTLRDGLVMSVMGVIGGAGHYCLILAYRAAPASVVAPFNYAGLVFSALLAWAIFAELPDAWTWAGAAVIVGAGLYVWHRERVRAVA